MNNLARKYRPRCLDDLVGQPSVVRTLTNAFKAKKLHQAYLFVGQFGSGKTTAARIIAAMENASKGPTLYPDADDIIAKKIFEGKHTDVEEIDAASGAGKAEQIRLLKNSALYHAVDGCKVKYYIVDECLPYESLVTVDGQERPIGEVVEEGIDGTCDRQITGQDMSNDCLIDRKILRYIKIPNDKQMYEIDIRDANGDTHTIRITGNHNVFVHGEDQMKVKAEDLKIGQKVFLEES